MVTEGKDSVNNGYGITRRSIEGGDKIPNVAIFLKRTALEFLQIIFSTRGNGFFRYDEDDTKTEIQISDVHAMDLTSVSRRPAIIAVRGPLSWQGIGLGGGGVQSVEMSTRRTVMTDLLTGSVAFSVISREGIEAEQIAHVVFNSFKFFRPILMKYGFFNVTSLNIGAEALVEQEGSDDKTTVVPVYLSAQVQDRWALEETAARTLQGIIISNMATFGIRT